MRVSLWLLGHRIIPIGGQPNADTFAMTNDGAAFANDFLASTADILGLFAHLASSERRRSPKSGRGAQLAQQGLSQFFPSPASSNRPTPLPESPHSPVRSGDTARCPIEIERKSRVLRRGHCQCGECKWCLDNARWERVFNEKFADPTYYSSAQVRHNSSLAGAR